MELTWIFLLISAIQLVFGLQLPSGLNKCKFSDQICLAKGLKKILQRFGKTGIPEWNIPPLVFLKLPDTKFVDDDPHKPLSYQVQITNVTAYGFENSTITKVRSDLKQKKIEIYANILNLVGKMKSSVKARIFFGYFNASGRTISELQNVRLIWKVFLDFGNQGYIKVYKLFLYTKIDRAVFDVTDVNYVNTDLAIVVSQWMNDNWHEFWSEFEPTIVDGFSEYFIEFANDKLNALRVRYDDLFLPEDDGGPIL